MHYLYGIPNCDTVKKARIFLEERNIPHTFVDFKKVPPSSAQLKQWTKAYGDLPVNKKGQTYRKLGQEFEALSSSAKITFLIENSSMIKRPILQQGEEVLAFGFDQSEYQKKLGVS
jgi:Spx/MgsR family transcriptional regulator